MSDINVGAAVKELREFKGWTLSELARRSGVSKSIISRMESADNWNVTLVTVKRVADALGVSVGDLFNYKPRQRVECLVCHGRGWLFKS